MAESPWLIVLILAVDWTVLANYGQRRESVLFVAIQALVVPVRDLILPGHVIPRLKIVFCSCFLSRFLKQFLRCIHAWMMFGPLLGLLPEIFDCNRFDRLIDRPTGCHWLLELRVDHRGHSASVLRVTLSNESVKEVEVSLILDELFKVHLSWDLARDRRKVHRHVIEIARIPLLRLQGALRRVRVLEESIEVVVTRQK